MQQPEIRIAAKAKRNAWFITLCSVLALLVVLLVSQFYWQQAKFSLMLLLLLSLSFIFLGILKLLEPKNSFILSPEHITFYHRKGRWQIPWDNIRTIHPITNTYGITQEQLCYIGLTLHSFEQLKDHISPRLANHLIHEQKPLVTYCVARELMPIESAIISFDGYKCQNGDEIKGPLAGFFHQCRALHQALGADIFINDSYIDRDVDAFAQLLKQCKSAAKNYQSSH
ncbi:hypothetical protein tinsulaeT_17740 [Thalassotalea insulae]|uniref:DUF2982 domain-containing protein n=1 Tax=Thalassotalea insulae TaxID=2056778 RepID=A0ABQ6GS23_9GAMM|nr:DUF2982 domain-containing protein [Thalassotalea insulae]GLX78434.1 hypothetical protein tinsulaeT_17740 [Thalassotalea insulae]